MEWTQDSTLGFIELHEEISVLWDPNHPKYYNKLHKHLPTRSSEQLMDHSAQSVRRNARRFVRTYTSGRAEPRAVTLRQIAQVWTRPKISLSSLTLCNSSFLTRSVQLSSSTFPHKTFQGFPGISELLFEASKVSAPYKTMLQM
jgi:hypothetical protein